jgi:hypothetical protein
MSTGVVEENAEISIKVLLSAPKFRIRLDDYVTGILRKTIEAVTANTFWNPLPELTAEGIQQRLTRYEETMSDLLPAVILLGRWGQGDQVTLVEKILMRLAEANKAANGLVVWQSMRWYPISILIYAAGITALSCRNYPMLAALLRIKTNLSTRANSPEVLFVRALDEMTQLDSTFKYLPVHARDHVPRSEYFFNILQPALDSILFLGDSYEHLFDEFEIISALVYADLQFKKRGRVWARPGRFGYKYGSTSSPIDLFIADAESAGANMPLLRQGFFNSSDAYFQEIAKAYLSFLSKMPFY